MKTLLFWGKVFNFLLLMAFLFWLLGQFCYF